MDHAHGASRSLPDLSIQQQPHRRRPYDAPPSSSPFAPPPPQSDPSINAHQRRLQLRNVGFRAPQLSAQRLGPRFSTLFNSNEEPQFAPATEQKRENITPRRRSMRSTRSEHQPSASLGILYEISHSTRGLHSSKRATIAVPIHKDDLGQLVLESSPVTPALQTYQASSTLESPMGLHHNHELSSMKLREVSGNECRRSPLPSSPLSAGSKGRRKTLSTRKPNFEAAEYIEHIEKQLQQAKEMICSPNSGKPLPEKMKALREENKQLKQTIEQLEESFESRVKNSVEHMTAGEGELRRKIKNLEDELMIKNVTIQELEYQHDQSRLDQGTLDSLKATIEKLEAEKHGLEETNRNIEKRNETLTELLAFSPTKSQHGFEPASPLRSYRTSRPSSMMIRFPSSPSREHASRQQSMAAFPVGSPTSYFSPRSALDLELGSPCDDHDADTGLGDSCSATPPVMTSSRRSTMHSQTSASPSMWGLTLPMSPIDGNETTRQPQKRKPRKFMTGSTQLKPLLLPSMAAEGSGVPSPKSPDRCDMSEESVEPMMVVYSDIEALLNTPKREISGQSIDPTVSFLSNPFDDVLANDREDTFQPTSSPPQSGHTNQILSQNSVGLADQVETAAFIYDGLPSNPDLETGVEEDLTILPGTIGQFQSAFSAPLKADDHTYQFIQKGPCLSLRTPDQSKYPLEALAVSPTSEQHQFCIGSSPSPRKRRKISFSPDAKVPSPDVLRRSGPGPGSAKACHVLSPMSLTAKASHQSLTPQVSRQKQGQRPASPLEMLQRRDTSTSRPIAAVTIQSISVTLSKYTTYIRDFKRDPFALARRVIANAWFLNWKKLGRFSWWVLGFFLRGSGTIPLVQASWDWDHYDGEAVANRICLSDNYYDTEHEFHTSRSPIKSQESRHVNFDEPQEERRTNGSNSPAMATLKQSKKEKTGVAKSLYLWGKFSVAILMAVGGAVLKGPAEMLKDRDQQLGLKGESAEYTDRSASISSQSDEREFGGAGPSLPSRIFTFGSPSHDEGWDYFDDYGGPKPSRCREQERTQRDEILTQDARVQENPD